MRQHILVTGFTGRLGSLVAECLRDKHGVKPKVLVRPDRVNAPGWQPPDGMQVMVGDYDHPESLDAALASAEAVFLVSPVHPRMQERELTLAASAARQEKPPHIVKISGLGTRLDSSVDSGRWHAEIERDILELGLGATFLRPLFFMQNLSFQADSMRDAGVLRGAVAEAAIAMVDARDIAEVAAAVLAGGSPIEGEAVSVTGSESYTYSQVAKLASTAFNRTITYQMQTLDDTRAALEKSGQPQWHVDILMQFNEAFLTGQGSRVEETVNRVLHRAPRSLAAYLGELSGGAQASGSNPFPSA